MLQAISLKHKVVTFLEGKATVLINKIHSITETIYTATHHHRHNIHGHMTSQTQYTRSHDITDTIYIDTGYHRHNIHSHMPSQKNWDTEAE